MMNINTFATQSGIINYSIQASNRSGSLEFGFGYSGTGAADPLVKKVIFSGGNKKLYDTDDNFFLGLTPDSFINLSGTIFTGHHGYFVNNSNGSHLITNKGSRVTGVINCTFYQSDALDLGESTADSLFRVNVQRPS
jgi:hypothetical protein